MAVLTRIRNGWLPDGWHMDEGEGVVATDLHGSPDHDQEWLAAWWLAHGRRWGCHCHRLPWQSWPRSGMAGCLMTGTWTTVRVSLPQTSMVVLTRIRNGWLPDGWHMDDSDGVCSRITFMYVPGHAGVAINETADSLASSCQTPVPLQLYSANIKLRAKKKAWEETADTLKTHLKVLASNWKTPGTVLHVRAWDLVPPGVSFPVSWKSKSLHSPTNPTQNSVRKESVLLHILIDLLCKR